MALIYDGPVDEEFNVCAIGSNGEYFIYLYKDGKRGTVYNSVTVHRSDTPATSDEITEWVTWALDNRPRKAL